MKLSHLYYHLAYINLGNIWKLPLCSSHPGETKDSVIEGFNLGQTSHIMVNSRLTFAAQCRSLLFHFPLVILIYLFGVPQVVTFHVCGECAAREALPAVILPFPHFRIPPCNIFSQRHLHIPSKGTMAEEDI